MVCIKARRGDAGMKRPGGSACAYGVDAGRLALSTRGEKRSAAKTVAAAATVQARAAPGNSTRARMAGRLALSTGGDLSRRSATLAVAAATTAAVPSSQHGRREAVGRAGGWRQCPRCWLWVGAGCVPEACWAGDFVSLCRARLQLRDREHAILVARLRELEPLRDLISRFTGWEPVAQLFSRQRITQLLECFVEGSAYVGNQPHGGAVKDGLLRTRRYAPRAR